METTPNEIELEDLQRLVIQAERDNELGDGNLFAILFRNRLLLDNSMGADGWHTWDGQKWVAASQASVRLFVMQDLADVFGTVATRIDAEATKILKDLERVDEYKWLVLQAKVLHARRAELQNKMRADRILSIAGGVAGMFTDGGQWDANPWLLPVANGVLDLKLDAAVRFRPAHPSDLVRTTAPVEYREGASMQAWEAFVASLFDTNPDQKEIVDFLQRLFGYCVTGVSLEKILPVLYGPGGDNGKSTLFEVLREVLGNFAVPSPAEIILKQDRSGGGTGLNPLLHNLMGRRLVWISETNKRDELNPGVVKSLTGNDSVTARTMYARPITFQPTHKIMLITNDKPRATSADDALWKRVCLIPFELKFVAHPSAPNERLFDLNIKARLVAEASGILNWLVAGCLEWQRRGSLGIPACLSMATQAFRDEQNLIKQWIDDRGHLVGNYQAQAQPAYDDYKQWSSDQGWRVPMSPKEFRDQMERNTFARKSLSSGNVYVGLGLADRTREAVIDDTTRQVVAMEYAAKRRFDMARDEARKMHNVAVRAATMNVLDVLEATPTKQMEVFGAPEAVVAPGNPDEDVVRLVEFWRRQGNVEKSLTFAQTISQPDIRAKLVEELRAA